MNTLRLALRMLARDWRAGELTRADRGDRCSPSASVGTVGFFADRVKGALDAAGEPAARRRRADLRRSAAAGDASRTRRAGAGSRRRRRSSSTAWCSASARDARRRRGAGRRQGGRRPAIRCAARSCSSTGDAPSAVTRGRHSAARRSVARCAARRAPRRRKRGDPIAVGDATLKVTAHRAAGTRSRERHCSRSARGCSSISTTSRRRTCCSRAIARRIGCSSPTCRRGMRSIPYLDWLQRELQAGPADGERARPAAGGAADARARRAISRTLGARRGDARRGRRRARRVALSAPPSRCRGDAALLRRIAAARRSRCSSLQFGALGLAASAAGIAGRARRPAAARRCCSASIAATELAAAGVAARDHGVRHRRRCCCSDSRCRR